MGKQRILLVDDEPDILEFIEYNLVKEGYDVHTAGNGRVGVEMAKKLLPDLGALGRHDARDGWDGGVCGNP